MKGSELGNTLYAEYETGGPGQTWSNMINIQVTYCAVQIRWPEHRTGTTLSCNLAAW
jgi:hypothetical protein